LLHQQILNINTALFYFPLLWATWKVHEEKPTAEKGDATTRVLHRGKITSHHKKSTCR